MNSEYDENGCVLLLKKWMGGRSPNKNMELMKLEEIDQEVGLPSGSAGKYLEIAAKHWGYSVSKRGAKTITLERRAHA
ncbi:hypothetical protein HY229_00820 [Candidatus Acetothermia bacterium]|nr:hypothetical protein [Candidatus Acetothermia bacterium]MBI3642633.1 hypothetical protein [Candidatus Acetothermia bacterium]